MASLLAVVLGLFVASIFAVTASMAQRRDLLLLAGSLNALVLMTLLTTVVVAVVLV